MSDGTNDLNFLEVSSKLMEAAAKSEHKINRLFACFAWMTRLWQRLRQSGGVLGKKGREVVRVAKWFVRMMIKTYINLVMVFTMFKIIIRWMIGVLLCYCYYEYASAL